MAVFFLLLFFSSYFPPFVGFIDFRDEVLRCLGALGIVLRLWIPWFSRGAFVTGPQLLALHCLFWPYVRVLMKV